MEKILLTDEMDKTLREFIRNAYGDRPAYPWLAEDILEEMEELISDELEICREVYPVIGMAMPKTL